jgi:hypothetical protein
MMTAAEVKIGELEKKLAEANDRLARVEQTLKERGNINTAAVDLEKRVSKMENTIPDALKRIEDGIRNIGSGGSPFCIQESDRITACEIENKRLSNNHEESTKHWETEWRERKDDINSKTTKKSLELATARLWWAVGLIFTSEVALLLHFVFTKP